MDLVYGMMSISQLLAFPHTLLIVFVRLFVCLPEECYYYLPYGIFL